MDNLYLAFRPLVERRAAPALVESSGRTFSFAELDSLSGRIAQLLVDLGLEPGDRLSVQVEKSAVALAVYLACLRAGLVFHPLNPSYRDDEVAYFLADAEPAALICDPERSLALAAIARDCNISRVLTLDGEGAGSLPAACGAVSAELPCVASTPHDLAALLYSSGTTGDPKGVMLNHGNLVANARALVEAWRFTAEDRLLHALPIFHVHGLFVAVGCALMSGAALQWLTRFDVDSVISALPQCSVMMGVPTHYTRLLADPRLNPERCGSMRLFVSGSAPLQETTFAQFEQRTGHRILERYGMTETNMNTSNPLEGPRKAGTVGLPLPGVDLRIVDDANRTVSPGTTGQLQVRGDNVFGGYWKRPQRSREDFTDDGFFVTGDLARCDSEGYVVLAGRSKDLVITGGLNVYPSEVEAVIDRDPSVIESAVIGVPHPDFGEAVIAVVVPASSPPLDIDQLRTALQDRLAGYKLPKRILTTRALPRNTMGKVLKGELREQYRELFG